MNGNLFLLCAVFLLSMFFLLTLGDKSAEEVNTAIEKDHGALFVWSTFTNVESEAAFVC